MNLDFPSMKNLAKVLQFSTFSYNKTPNFSLFCKDVCDGATQISALFGIEKIISLQILYAETVVNNCIEPPFLWCIYL